MSAWVPLPLRPQGHEYEHTYIHVAFVAYL